MKIYLIQVLIIFSAFACVETDPVHINKNETTIDTIRVDFGEKVSLNWNTVDNIFVYDSNYINLKDNFDTLKYSFVKYLNDTTDLGVKVCTKYSSNLTKGDLVLLFLLIQEVSNGGDLYLCNNNMSNCCVPDGLLNYFEENRDTVYKKLISGLDSMKLTRPY